MSEQLNFNNVKIYSIDLTLTDDCNFNCSYCFEHGYFNKNYFRQEDLFIAQMLRLLESDFFKTKYQLLGVGFWGGEPTLNHKAIRIITEYFANDNRVKFFIYSNGSNIKPLYDLLIKYKNVTLAGGHPKFCIQMSYDGMPVHDICRKSKKGSLTSGLVRGNIEKLDIDGIPSTIKSTITPETFKYMFDAYMDLRQIYVNYADTPTFRSQNYFPTIDYYHIESFSPEELEQYNKDLEIALTKIAGEEIQFHKKSNRFFFAWFNPNKALCCAGRDMICVNWDLNIFKCHGSVYEDCSGDHFLTRLDDKDFISKIESSHFLHAANFYKQPEECINCSAPYCLRCNPVKFERSDKKEYIDKWRDYTVQPGLCTFYKTNGKITRAIQQIINSGGT